MNDHPKIVVVGSANTDLVLQLPHLPATGETVTANQFIQTLGGKGANQAVAAARLGAGVTLVCRLGRDGYGQGCYQAYQREGMQVDFIAWDDQAPSGVCFIFINPQGENMLGFAAGANMRLSAEDVERAEAAIAAADVLVVQFEVPVAADLKAAEIAHRHGVPVILNPAPAVPIPPELLSRVDYLTPNETELDLILKDLATQSGVGERGLDWLSAHVPQLVITLGAQGCRVLAHGADTTYPAFAVQAVDTTGAGDAFNGGLAVALARGLDLPAAIRFASAVAAISVTRLGAQPSLPTLAEVQELLG